MKKILSLTIIAVLALITLTTNVNAADVLTEADLKNEVLADTTITLAKDIELTSALEIGKNVKINLNGHSITAADGMLDDSLIIVLHGGTLTVEGNGSISATNSNASARIAVKMTKAGCDTTKQAKLVLNSGTLEGTSFGISGNGNPDRVNTSVTINGGTVKGNSTGIYHPQEGTLTINGGTVKGSTGIEMRSGTLLVTGGTIIGTGAPTNVAPNGNGTTTDGAGIAVAQHTTEKNINVTVEGGNVQGYSAVYESNPESNSTMDKVSLQIYGGEFEAINGGKLAVYSEDKKDFISGGKFNSDVSKYVEKDTVDVVEDEDGNIYVGELNNITIKDSKNGKVEADKKEAVEGQLVTLNVKPDEGYELKSLTVVTVEEDKVEVEDEKFVMPNMDVIVSAEFEEIKDMGTSGDEPVEEPVKDDKKDETPKTGAFDIALYVLVTIAVVSVVGVAKAKRPARHSK